jgi:hypothetical protein
VEFTPFISLGPPEVVLRLAGAELAEILGGLGDDIGEELELDSAQGFTWSVSVGYKDWFIKWAFKWMDTEQIDEAQNHVAIISRASRIFLVAMTRVVLNGAAMDVQ